MALLSAANLIRSFAAFHLIIAYFLLTSPVSVGTHNIVLLLSASFGLPYNPPSMKEPSAVTALLGAVLAYYSISDILAASMREEVSFFYWRAQVPTRLMFFFAITAYAVLSRPGGLASLGKTMDMSETTMLSMTGPGQAEGGLSNGVVFSWGVLSVLAWFWIYNTLRGEGKVIVPQAQKRE